MGAPIYSDLKLSANLPQSQTDTLPVSFAVNLVCSSVSLMIIGVAVASVPKMVLLIVLKHRLVLT